WLRRVTPPLGAGRGRAGGSRGRAMGLFDRSQARPGAGSNGMPRQPGRRRRGMRLVRIVAVAVVFLAVGAGLFLGSAFSYYSAEIPNPLILREKRTAAVVVRVLARDGSVLAERGGGPYVPIDLLPRHLIHAVLATEDRRFYWHWGVDPVGLGRAIAANLRAGRVVQGGSTITQQLAKSIIANSERTLARKLEELVLALWLETHLRKPDILELYLNRVYFGAGAYGVEAAARRFFEKGAKDLTLGESAVLAGLIKAPSRYSPAWHPKVALERGRKVL